MSGNRDGPRAYAAGTRGRCPLDSRQGAALWTPGRALPCTRWGRKPPDPEMLSHLYVACGRDGGFCPPFTLRDPARQNGGGLVGVGYLMGGFPLSAQNAQKVAGIMTPATFFSFS
ncbi:hypothetical protein D7X33_18720 [Butyricicoccus sp. 1XD8-22]|nr:hypothetical protein D7X33_18720 [Butyricicoccus sp. 1XD8-22]